MKNKVIIVLLVLIVAIGAFIIWKNGFNLDFEYNNSKKINIQFKESFQISDVNNMAKEVLGNQKYKIDYIDEFEGGVVITTENITDEQIDSLEGKLKEKYKTFATEEENEENNEEENQTHNNIVQIRNMPKAKTYDLVKEYIFPIIITTVIAIAFLGIMFNKIGTVKSIVIPACTIVGGLAVYISAIAILRIPVNEYVISIGMFVYIMSLIGTAIYLKAKKD